MVNARSENNTIRVSVKNTSTVTKANASSMNNSSPVNASNNKAQMYEQQALGHANTAKQYAEQAEQSANNAQSYVESVIETKDELLNNEDFKTVVANIDNINTVGENIENIITIAEDLEGVADNLDVINNVNNNLEVITNVNTNIQDIQNAEENANVAKEKAQESADYSELSKQWAISETLVDNADYSSKHYATVAKEEANKAELYKGQASQHAEDAQRDANIASASSSSAYEYLEATTEQANISTTNAEISITQASNALKSAENAALSEASAKESENKAKVSEQNAKSSEQRCEEIYARLGIVIIVKGRVDNLEDLPTTDVVNGDAYLVGVDGLDSYPEYYWYEDHWEYMGSTDVKLEWGNVSGTLSNQSDLQAVLDKKLENQSRFKDGLSIGKDNIDGGLATVIGFRNNAVNSANGILIGYDNWAIGYNNVCIGKWCEASDNGICIGNGACTVEQNSIQLGEGFNTTPNSFQVSEHQLLNIETGKIPDERLSTNIAKLTDIPDTNNLATKTELTEGLATKQPLGDYAYKSDIPDLTNYVKNTDYATTSSVGLVKVAAATGINVNKEGKIYISKAPDESIVAKTEQYRPLTPSNIDLAIKTGITTNTIELTDEEKTSVKEWLGISGGGLPVGFIFWGTYSEDYVPKNSLKTDGTEFTAASGQMFNQLWTGSILTGELDTCSYSEYETEVTMTGSCYKWAVDTANQKFRIPFVPDKVLVDIDDIVSVIGNGKSLGMNDGTEEFTLSRYGGDAGIGIGAVQAELGSKTISLKVVNRTIGLSQIAENSGANAVTTDAKTYKTIRHYVVVSTGSINQSEADWSEFASSLASKANIDGSNFNASVKNFDGQWVAKTAILTEAVTKGITAMDLSDYLPKDNYQYEVLLICAWGDSGANDAAVYSDIIPRGTMQLDMSTNGFFNGSYITMPIGTGRVLYQDLAEAAIAEKGRGIEALAYRRIGTNQ